jgi:hypothetical protein
VGKPETPYLKEMTYMIKISPIILAEMTCITLSEKSDIVSYSSNSPSQHKNISYKFPQENLLASQTDNIQSSCFIMEMNILDY